jgi:hypothetical protein
MKRDQRAGNREPGQPGSGSSVLKQTHYRQPARGGERRPIGLWRFAEVGEHTGAYDLRVGVEVAKQFDGHVAARVEQAK